MQCRVLLMASCIAELPSLLCCGETYRFKFNAAYVFDSAGAFFGWDNVGLAGFSTYFKVLS